MELLVVEGQRPRSSIRWIIQMKSLMAKSLRESVYLAQIYLECHQALSGQWGGELFYESLSMILKNSYVYIVFLVSINISL